MPKHTKESEPMKQIIFSSDEFTDRELRKIWRVLCGRGIENEVQWKPNAKKLDRVEVTQ